MSSEPEASAPAVVASQTGVIRICFVADRDEQSRLIQSHPEAVLVSARLPLRANLTVLENVAVVLQFRRGADAQQALGSATDLLERVGLGHCSGWRDPDLGHEERFLAKLLRAVALAPPIILIDRPGRQLPDTHYPPFLDAKLSALEDRFAQCWIVDYEWNAPLYPRRG